MPLLVSIILKVLAMAVRRERKKKKEPRLERKKFADGMMVYVENPKDTIKKLLELINEFIKVAKYNIRYRNLLHFHTLKMKYQKEKLRKQSYLQLYQKE